MLLYIDILSSIIAVTGIGAATSSLITLFFSYLKRKHKDKPLEIKVNDQKFELSSGFSEVELAEFIKDIVTKIKPRVFISYANQDKEKALNLAETLKANGFEIWIDEYNLRLGDSISEKILEGIKHSSYFLLIITEEFLNSNWVEKELNLMIGSIKEFPNRKIIPLLYDKDIELPVQLRDILYLDYSSDVEKSNKKLIEFLSEDDKKTTANILYK